MGVKRFARTHSAVTGQVPGRAREVLELVAPAPEGPAARDAHGPAAGLLCRVRARRLLAEGVRKRLRPRPSAMGGSLRNVAKSAWELR